MARDGPPDTEEPGQRARPVTRALGRPGCPGRCGRGGLCWEQLRTLNSCKGTNCPDPGSPRLTWPLLTLSPHSHARGTARTGTGHREPADVCAQSQEPGGAHCARDGQGHREPSCFHSGKRLSSCANVHAAPATAPVQWGPSPSATASLSVPERPNGVRCTGPAKYLTRAAAPSIRSHLEVPDSTCWPGKRGSQAGPGDSLAARLGGARRQPPHLAEQGTAWPRKSVRSQAMDTRLSRQTPRQGDIGGTLASHMAY